MLRLAFLTFLIALAAAAMLVASAPPEPPPQPIEFSHKVHLDYFQQGRHQQEMISLHEGLLAGYLDGSHGESMVSMHQKTLMEALEDEEIVGEMIAEIEKGTCTQCHGDFDRNAKDLARLGNCAHCHRRMESGSEGFGDKMIADVEQGRCRGCHGDFEANAKDLARLGRCAQCHRVALDHDWVGREDQRPCMGCHNGVVQFPRASIPNTATCAACHPLPLGDGPQEPKLEEPRLVEFIEGERSIGWAQVYDYLPGSIVFSHEQHVEFGRVKCQECHGPVEQADSPLFLNVNLSMEDCMDCHEARGANNDCLACHR